MSVTLFGVRNGYESPKYNIELGLYPDNSPVVNLEEAWNGSQGGFNSILLRPDTMQDFFTGMFIVDSIRERGGYVNNLILPCIPGQRQDRLKWEGDWLVTLKSVAKIINSMKFDKVLVLDPHSVAAEAAIDRLKVLPLHLSSIFERHGVTPDYTAIVAPDAGAAKRAEEAGRQFGVPVYYATKHRHPATNKLTGFQEPHDLPANSRVLVVDDLCDAGGTFLGLAEALEDGNATADLFVTHGLFTKGTEQLAKSYRSLYTTDSTPNRHERVTYFEVSEGMNYFA